MIVTHRTASPSLRSVVASFSERRAMFGAEVVTAPLLARPDQFIEVYLGDHYAVAEDDGPARPAPEMVVVGPQSYRLARLFMSGTVHVFTMRFQPGGLHALFGLPMPTLVNEGVAAADVLGSAAHALREGVLMAPDFDARVDAAERWVAGQMIPAGRTDQVARLATALLRSGGRLGIRALASRAGLSDRQFTRRFETQVGLTPKLFARTVRLNRVLDAKARAPGRSWTVLLHDAGYADQAHFVRDCRALAGGAPSAFLREWAPGR